MQRQDAEEMKRENIMHVGESMKETVDVDLASGGQIPGGKSAFQSRSPSRT